MNNPKSRIFAVSCIIFFILLTFSNSISAQKKKRQLRAPTISLAKIYKDIVDQSVEEIPSENSGEDQAINWVFAKNETREIEVLERNFEAETASVIINIYTQDDSFKLKGNLQLNYERVAGGWNLTEIENLSLKYSDYNRPKSNNSTFNQTPTQSKISLINSAFTLGSGQHLPIRFIIPNKATIIGRFQAQGGSGNDVKVYVLSEDGYTNFKNRHNVPTFYNSGQVTVGTLNTLLGAGVYYLVFDNGYSLFSNKAISANIELHY
jgi:hypothetical protein